MSPQSHHLALGGWHGTKWLLVLGLHAAPKIASTPDNLIYATVLDELNSVASELWGQGGTLYPQVQELYPLYTQVKDAAYVKILSKRL